MPNEKRTQSAMSPIGDEPCVHAFTGLRVAEVAWDEWLLRSCTYVSPISLLTLHPTNIAWLKLSGKSPMDMSMPPLWIKIMLESNPLKSTMLVGRLGVRAFLLATAPPPSARYWLYHHLLSYRLKLYPVSLHYITLHYIINLSLSLYIYIYILHT